METKKEEKKFGMFDWWKKVVIENYANFDGRARRSEYWYFVLVNIIITFLCYGVVIIGAIIDVPAIAAFGAILILLFALGIFIPNLAVIVRRLHDTNKSGWMILIGLIPLAGIILLIFYCTEGDKGDNQYGGDPKNIDYDKEINAIGEE